MKASELIGMLKQIIDVHGDMLVDVNLNDNNIYLVDDVNTSKCVSDNFYMATLDIEQADHERVKNESE